MTGTVRLCLLAVQAVFCVSSEQYICRNIKKTSHSCKNDCSEKDRVKPKSLFVK